MINNPSPPSGGGFVGWIESHPTLLLLIIGVAAFGVFFLKQQSAASTAATTATTTPVDTSGLTLDANGNPIEYRDVADTFITTSTTGSNNTTTNDTYPIEPTTPTTSVAYVRGRYSNAQVSGYDKANPGGVPIRSSASGSATVLRLQAYGSAVTITSAAVTGASNLTTSASGSIVTGSASWLPVAGGGYISAYDVTGVSS
jgi:hypothetical protein